MQFVTDPCPEKDRHPGRRIRSLVPALAVQFEAFLLCVCLLFGLTTGCNRSQPYLVSAPSGFSLPVPPGSPAAGGANVLAPANANAYAAQMSELERRAKLLDDNNRQLHTQLAQSQQQMQLFKDRSDLMQRQVQDLSGQLQQARIASARASSSQPPGTANSLSMEAPNPRGLPNEGSRPDATRKSGARLTANTSNRLSSEAIRSLGYEVETDGRVVRLRIPADQLFQSNTAQLTPSAANILDRVSDVIKSEYSTQRIAIEGHTDNGPIYGGSYSTPHQLASAQTNAVFEHMTRRNQLPTTQLFTLAHGSNYPLEDNQSAGGRASNRRIEFVVYPETF